MDVNAYYAGAENESQKYKDTQDVKHYNQMVDDFNEVLGKIKAQFNKGILPKKCDWIVLNGNKQASWKLREDLDSDQAIYLLPDARIAEVNWRPNPPQFVRYIDLKKVSKASQIPRRSWNEISRACRTIVDNPRTFNVNMTKEIWTHFYPNTNRRCPY